MEEIRTGKSFKIISDTMEKCLNKALKNEEVSASQGIMLVWLSEEESNELPIKAIEKLSATSQPTTLGVINRLEQKGFVTTYLTQQRTKIVKITEKGLSLVKIIEEHIHKIDEILFEGFDNKEKEMFFDFLERATTNILKL